MVERGVIFSGPMVRALLDGNKTQTRRIAKLKPIKPGLNFGFSGLYAGHYCTGSLEHGWVLSSRDGQGVWNDRTRPAHNPHGQKGDILWVKETWAPHPDGDGLIYHATDPGWDENDSGIKWKSPIFMSRVNSRIDLCVCSSRLERLHKITTEDCIAEGLSSRLREYDAECDLRNQYRELWESLHGAGSWERNDWVWVTEFSVSAQASTDEDGNPI